jgi:anti-sigma factor RsiW
MDERLLIELSAYADGELDAAARAALEHDLAARPELRPLLAQFRRLDAAAAALPVPQIDASVGWQMAPVPEQVARRLDQAADAAVPTVPDGKYLQVWEQIAARTVLGGVPQVAGEQWDKIWRKVSQRTVFQGSRRHWWLRRLVLAGASAAAALFFFYLMWPATEPPGTVTMLMPEVLDDRYQLQVHYLEGSTNPVVCFYLRSDEPGEEAPAAWLPD